jgi:hypothetical protein
MNSIRRELLNGVFVLVVASLMSAVFAAFQLSFNVQLLGIDIDRHQNRGERVRRI